MKKIHFFFQKSMSLLLFLAFIIVGTTAAAATVCVCGYVRIPMLHAVFHRGGQINDDMSGIKRSKREANKTLLEGSEFYLGRE